jgi:hypothetical protein
VFCTSLQDGNNVSEVTESENDITHASFESNNKRKRSEDNHLLVFNSSMIQVKHN